MSSELAHPSRSTYRRTLPARHAEHRLLCDRLRARPPRVPAPRPLRAVPPPCAQPQLGRCRRGPARPPAARTAPQCSAAGPAPSCPEHAAKDHQRQVAAQCDTPATAPRNGRVRRDATRHQRHPSGRVLQSLSHGPEPDRFHALRVCSCSARGARGARAAVRHDAPVAAVPITAATATPLGVRLSRGLAGSTAKCCLLDPIAVSRTSVIDGTRINCNC